MAKIKDSSIKSVKTKQKQGMPAKTIEGLENRLIAKATARIEQRIDDGTATAQELLFFAKMGTTSERLDKEIKERQKDLVDAKTESLKTSRMTAELMQNVMDAIKTYRGEGADINE